MGLIDESANRLKKNVDHINSGEAVHPFSQGTPTQILDREGGKAEHAGSAMYHRFYGKK